MKQYSTQHTSNRTRTKSNAALHTFLRAVLLATFAVVLTSLIIGFVWGWYMALLFLVGGLFFACCCFLSYYNRISFSFNNIADTNQSSFLAFFTNSIPRPPRRFSGQEEDFQPFKFASRPDSNDCDSGEQKALEDMRVRAILRQVFPDEEL